MGDGEIPKSWRLVGRGTVSHVKGKRKKYIYNNNNKITKQRQGNKKKKHVRKKKSKWSGRSMCSNMRQTLVGTWWMDAAGWWGSLQMWIGDAGWGSLHWPSFWCVQMWIGDAGWGSLHWPSFWMSTDVVR